MGCLTGTLEIPGSNPGDPTSQFAPFRKRLVPAIVAPVVARSEDRARLRAPKPASIPGFWTWRWKDHGTDLGTDRPSVFGWTLGGRSRSFVLSEAAPPLPVRQETAIMAKVVGSGSHRRLRPQSHHHVPNRQQGGEQDCSQQLVGELGNAAASRGACRSRNQCGR